MFTAIITILIAIALVLSATLISSSIVFVWNHTTYHIITEVVILGSMLVGVLLVGFRRIESRVRAKNQIKVLEGIKQQRESEVAQLQNNLSAMKATMAEKEQELARIKDELIRALQNQRVQTAPQEPATVAGLVGALSAAIDPAYSAADAPLEPVSAQGEPVSEQPVTAADAAVQPVVPASDAAPAGSAGEQPAGTP